MAQCDIIAPLLGTFEDGELPPHEMQQVSPPSRKLHKL